MNYFRMLAMVVLAGWAPVALADIVRCKSVDGRVVFSNTGAGCETGRAVRHAAEVVPELEQQRARDLALQDQRAAAMGQGSMGAIPSQQSATGAAQLGNQDRINQCLMRVTAQTGLSPRAEAAGRANCFRGARGRSNDCERAVSSTMRLSSADEDALHATCRSFR